MHRICLARDGSPHEALRPLWRRPGIDRAPVVGSRKVVQFRMLRKLVLSFESSSVPKALRSRPVGSLHSDQESLMHFPRLSGACWSPRPLSLVTASTFKKDSSQPATESLSSFPFPSLPGSRTKCLSSPLATSSPHTFFLLLYRAEPCLSSSPLLFILSPHCHNARHWLIRSSPEAFNVSRPSSLLRHFALSFGSDAPLPVAIHVNICSPHNLKATSATWRVHPTTFDSPHRLDTALVRPGSQRRGWQSLVRRSKGLSLRFRGLVEP